MEETLTEATPLLLPQWNGRVDLDRGREPAGPSPRQTDNGAGAHRAIETFSDADTAHTQAQSCRPQTRNLQLYECAGGCGRPQP